MFDSSQRPSLLKAAFVCLSAGLLTVALSVFFQTHPYSLQSFSYQLRTLAGEPASAGTSYQPVGVPLRLVIPSIGVDARVQHVGLAWQGDGTMGIPTNFTDVGWYKDGPRPGEPGSAVIDGHLDGKNVKEAVFYELDKLKPGDLVEVIDANGQTLRFRVVKSELFASDAPTDEIFADTTEARLNLITCAGDWVPSAKSYNEREVVFTVLEGS